MIRYFSTVKSLNDIPGPKSIPLIGTLWKYMPIIGDFKFDKLHETALKKLNQYGTIVKEEVEPGVYIINVFDAEDIKEVYKSEGKLPARRSHLAIQHYRLSRPDIYNTGGLIPTNGEDWWRLRSTFQKPLGRLKDVRALLKNSDDIANEFFDKRLFQSQLVHDFLPLISRLNLELTWMALFGRRIRSFDEMNFSEKSIPSRLINAAETVNCSIMRTDMTENIWKKFKTPTYKKMEKCLEFIEKIVLDELKNCIESPVESIAQQFLTYDNVDFKDVTGTIIDLVLGGVDTTSYTSSFLLYHLATHPDVQKKLKAEADFLLPTKNSPVTSTILNDAIYTRAVLKESLRLNPISTGISRNLGQDAILSGYLVPKGTLILTQNMIACRLESNFKKPLVFNPNRWLKNSSEYTTVSPFLILPFSHGPRTCIARRMAEQSLLLITLKIGQRYSVKWKGDGALGIITPLICKPDKPVTVYFENLK